MQTARSATRTLAAVPPRPFAASPALFIARSSRSVSPLVPTRTYATGQDAQAELQAKQLRLTEKMGRMKQSMGTMTSIPIFANHIRPAEGRVLAPDATAKLKRQYMIFDAQNFAYSLWIRYKWRKLLGSKWYEQFKERSMAAYQAMNQALATGNYDRARQFASTPVVDAIKAQRTRKLQGLRLSWKLHKVVEHEIVCARQQEVFKKDENIGQMAVKFVTEQSLEIRDRQGRLVGAGSHDRPELVTEYCIFQRDMWRPDDEWKCVKKGARETDTLANPADQP